LRLTVFQDLEVRCGQVRDDAALSIGDDRVDLDVVHLDTEGDGRLGCLRRGRRGRLLLRGDNGADRGHRKCERKSMSHNFFGGLAAPIIGERSLRHSDSRFTTGTGTVGTGTNRALEPSGNRNPPLELRTPELEQYPTTGRVVASVCL
jgi:hypothetical protein